MNLKNQKQTRLLLCVLRVRTPPKDVLRRILSFLERLDAILRSLKIGIGKVPSIMERGVVGTTTSEQDLKEAPAQ